MRRRCLKPGAVVSCAKELFFRPLDSLSGSDQAHAQYKARGSEAAPRGSRPASSERTHHARPRRARARRAGGRRRSAPRPRGPRSSTASRRRTGCSSATSSPSSSPSRSARGPTAAPASIRVSADLGAFLFVLALVRGQRPPLGRRGQLAPLPHSRSSRRCSARSSSSARSCPQSARGRSTRASTRSTSASSASSRASSSTASSARRTTEWFAFFYFLYFLILTVHVLPMLFWQRDLHVLGALRASGVLLIFMTAHLLYMVVPGCGPVLVPEGPFHHELHGRHVLAARARDGRRRRRAERHLPVPAHRRRRRSSRSSASATDSSCPFKYSWPVMAFVATQIIVATMFLRWHYLVDVVAGLTLASTAPFVGPARRRLGDAPSASDSACSPPGCRSCIPGAAPA